MKRVLALLTYGGFELPRRVCGPSWDVSGFCSSVAPSERQRERSGKQKLRWKEDLRTHLIRLTSNAPPDAVS